MSLQTHIMAVLVTTIFAFTLKCGSLEQDPIEMTVSARYLMPSCRQKMVQGWPGSAHAKGLGGKPKQENGPSFNLLGSFFSLQIGVKMTQSCNPSAHFFCSRWNEPVRTFLCYISSHLATPNRHNLLTSMVSKSPPKEWAGKCDPVPTNTVPFMLARNCLHIHHVAQEKQGPE